MASVSLDWEGWLLMGRAHGDVQIVCGTTGIRALRKLYRAVKWSGKVLILAAIFTVSFSASRSWKMSC